MLILALFKIVFLLLQSIMVSLILDWGARIPHALGPKSQNIKQKPYYNQFKKDLEKKGGLNLVREILEVTF